MTTEDLHCILQTLRILLVCLFCFIVLCFHVASTEEMHPGEPNEGQLLHPTDQPLEMRQTEPPNMRPLGARPKIPTKH